MAVAAAEPSPVPQVTEETLVLRGGMLIDGTGAPLRGPVDLVIRGNRIHQIADAGTLALASGDSIRELDLRGFYILPGLIDLYAPISDPPEYAMKLWLAHGITTVREPYCEAGIEACLQLKEASARNEIVAPRFLPYLALETAAGESSRSPALARDAVAEAAQAGAVGIEVRSGKPEVVRAALEEAERQGIGASCRLDVATAARVNALDIARWGGGLLELWHGVPEALLPAGHRSSFPASYDPRNPKARFEAAAAIWSQASEPGSERWNQVLDEMIEKDLSLIPALSLFEAYRDLMRARRADWHDAYTLPNLWQLFETGTDALPLEDWSTENEVAWKGILVRWMAFVDDYKNRGGRVGAGSGGGRFFNLYGFALVREMELLQEAGFHPMEALRAATSLAAEVLHSEAELGTVEAGKLADLVVVAGNPLSNFKVLYGSNEAAPSSSSGRRGGIRYTIKDGIVYDVPRLLAEVRQMVSEAKAGAGS